MQKIEEKNADLKSPAKADARKTYLAPRLTLQGKLEQITAGSGITEA
ncbi:MAG: hypothetical protein M3O30_15775 [Planctomycetota bacterium]|nr:hypothetical protein [Planctomycetota bacterium]